MGGKPSQKYQKEQARIQRQQASRLADQEREGALDQAAADRQDAITREGQKSTLFASYLGVPTSGNKTKQKPTMLA